MSSSPETRTPGAIHRLPEDVVNRIAAGEVIQRPANAVKELLENSIDAGATQVIITVKEGGVKLLQVQDNGHGIRKDDLAILCERHTTSKLQTFDDLLHINTLGFRGEALASISYISHLTVTTMTATDATHGWKATYVDGVLTPAPPKPCAAVKGTIIQAEDLFYNVPLRRKALKSASEEYSAVLDVVGRYAVYHAGASLTVKRQGEARVDLHTLPGANRIEAVRAVYGANVAKHLLSVDVKKGGTEMEGDGKKGEGGCSSSIEEDGLCCHVQGYVTSAEYCGKKTQLVLFINGRAVDCSPLKRTLEATYAALLPKTTKPFAFLDIKLPAAHVDVNVHPTKKEVAFLHQEDLIEAIRLTVEETLLASNATRTFTQTLLPGAPLPGSVLLYTSKGGESLRTAEPGTGGASGGEKPSYYRPDKLVRTDAKTQTLHAFFDPGAGVGVTPAGAAEGEEGKNDDAEMLDIDDEEDGEQGAGVHEQHRQYQQEEAANEEQTTRQLGEEQQQPSSIAAAAAAAAAPRRKRGPGHIPGGGGGEFEFMPTAMEIASAPGGLHLNNNPPINPPLQGHNYHLNGGSQVPTQGATGVGVGLAQVQGSQFIQRPVRHNRAVSEAEKSIRSVQKLLSEAEKAPHQGLKDILLAPTYVGLTDPTHALIQHGTRLYLADLSSLTQDMFYQQVLRRFGQAPRIRIQPGVGVRDLVGVALEAEEAAGTWEDSEEGGTKGEVADLLTALLVKKSGILSEFFSIDVDSDGMLTAIPQLIEQYTPDMDHLPQFILSLGQSVDWSEELSCFKSLAAALAHFYKLQPGLAPAEQAGIAYDSTAAEKLQREVSFTAEEVEGADKERKRREWIVQHVVLPALRLFLVPSKSRAGDGSLVELTRLENLYRVFERC